MKKFFKLFIFQIVLHFSTRAVSVTTINLYTYHDKPPYFYLAGQTYKGAYADFCSKIEKHSKLKCVISLVPRVRLEQSLISGKLDGAIIGVNPAWFEDKDKTKYIWSLPIFKDIDVIVSHRSNPLEFSLESLKNQKFVGVRGYYYHTIIDWVTQGHIKREDTNSELQNLLMVGTMRDDFTITSKATYRYYLAGKQISDKYYLARKEHDIFDRMILLPQNLKALESELNKAITELKADSSWQNFLAENKLDN